MSALIHKIRIMIIFSFLLGNFSGCALLIYSPRFTDDNQHLILALDRFLGDDGIYRIRTDGTEATPLTFSRKGVSDLEFSPHGSKIVFSKENDHIRGLEGDIFIINSDGSNELRLTKSSDDDGSPIFSADGQIYFVRGKLSFFGNIREPYLYAMNIDGSDLTKIAALRHVYSPPLCSISPDGKRVLMPWRDGLEIVPLETPSEVQYIEPVFEQDGVNHERTPRGISHGIFAPNGREVIFLYYDGMEIHYDFYKMDLASHKAERFFAFDDYICDVDLSSDGKEIVFTSTKTPYACEKLWLVNSDGSNLRQIKVKV